MIYNFPTMAEAQLIIILLNTHTQYTLGLCHLFFRDPGQLWCSLTFHQHTNLRSIPDNTSYIKNASIHHGANKALSDLHLLYKQQPLLQANRRSFNRHTIIACHGLSIIIANLFMNNLEEKEISTEQLKPALCIRYINDCFVI